MPLSRLRFEPGEEAPEHAAAGAVEEGAGDAVLFADDLVETFGVRVTTDDCLERSSNALVYSLRRAGGGPSGKGLRARRSNSDISWRRIGKLRIASGTLGAVFLGFAGAVHEVECFAAIGSGKAGESATLRPASRSCGVQTRSARADGDRESESGQEA